MTKSKMKNTYRDVKQQQRQQPLQRKPKPQRRLSTENGNF